MVRTVFIKAKSIILENKVVENAFLEIKKDGTFGSIVRELKESPDKVIDYSNFILAPGLVDTHIHGYQGFDVMDNDPHGLDIISQGLLACGVTSWLATTLTDSTENLNAVCETVGKHADKVKGAKIRGIFLEGPFFTEKFKGAQNLNYMGDPSIEKLDEWIELSQKQIKKIALAPERQGVIPFIKFASSKGVATALAHSDATYERAKEAVEAGASIFVHTFNGMRGLHHREPGMAGAALSLEDVYAEVIADGHHVHPATIDILVKARGNDETVLVTDCMRAGGLEEGLSRLGEYAVEIKDGQARLVEGGSLAGSILELIEAVKNMVEWKLTDLPTAVRMASLNPAKSVGIDHLCGKIAAGYEADFIVIDEAGNLKATYLNGEKRYQKYSVGSGI